MIPYMVGKLAPNTTHPTRRVIKYVPRRDYFRAAPSQNGDKFVTSPTPPIVEWIDRGIIYAARMGVDRCFSAAAGLKMLCHQRRLKAI